VPCCPICKSQLNVKVTGGEKYYICSECGYTRCVEDLRTVARMYPCVTPAELELLRSIDHALYVAIRKAINSGEMYWLHLFDVEKCREVACLDYRYSSAKMLLYHAWIVLKKITC